MAGRDVPLNPAGLEHDPLPTLISSIVGVVIENGAADAEPLLACVPQPQRLEVGGRAFTAKEQLRIFRRDSFTCRYCGKQTLFIPVLRILSKLFPEHLPHHPHWRWGATHPIYWTHGCSGDHLVPVSRGGDPGVSNLVTACYQCNSIKQQWLLEELRWSLLPPREPVGEWDGLSDPYLALCRATGADRDRYHAAWVRALVQSGRPKSR
jgi:5-methylcytosine-specific restriction endonuclease McrA